MGSKSYSKGITWINDCRIPFANLADADYTLSATYTKDIELKQGENWGTKKIGNVSKETGRFPANLLVCDDVLNDGVRYNTGGKQFQNYPSKNKTYSVNIGGGIHTDKNTYNDKGTNSRYYDIDKWFDNLLNSCG